MGDVAMKKILLSLIAVLITALLYGCAPVENTPQIVATTLPVYEFTSRLCQNTDLSVGRLITEEISCLHDYSLQVRHMRMIEGAQTVVISGMGMEDFLSDALQSSHHVIDASAHIEPLCPEDTHGHDSHEGHTHEEDPHIWLSPENAKIMAQTICDQLSQYYPQYATVFQKNASSLSDDLDALQSYGEETLSNLSCRDLVTFHDGFAYFANSFHLEILKSIEEESGREASAAELKTLIELVTEHRLATVFIEQNGSVSAADVIAAETGCEVYRLDMAMSGDSYFDAMVHNIDTVKEALQ